jgi:hypothetical protein
MLGEYSFKYQLPAGFPAATTSTEVHMELTDLIRASASDHEVRFLLASYLDAVRHGREPNGLADSIISTPLTDIDDVNRRIAALLGELDIASKRLDDRSCAQIKEALQVFATAFERMQCLVAQRNLASAKEMRAGM